MDVNALFTLALGITEPWRVVELVFSAEGRRLDIGLDFPPGSTFPCPVCGAASKVHDSKVQEWRHLNFFQHAAYLNARQPRTDCPKDGVKVVPVPWARPGAGFTLLFEALVVGLAANGMTASAIGRLVGEHDTRIWRVLEHYVDAARARESFAEVRKVGVDETSRAKGHVYVTVFADMEKAKVLYVTEGKDHETVARFKDDLVAHGGEAKRITDFSLDMSQAFIKGIGAEFPEAHVTFDKFHVIKLMNEALNAVRRDEQRERPELKKTHYVWLKNEENLTSKERLRFDALKDSTLGTARAYRLKRQLQELFNEPSDTAEAFFKRWYFWATHSKLSPVIRVAKTLHEHVDGLLRWFESRITNGLLEGINSLIQAAKARARGFSSPRKMKVMIYLLLAKLDFRLPDAFPSPVHTM